MLYIVATPIGNLKDITLRALEVLKNSDGIICEDTRRASILLNHYQIKKHFLILNDFNENKSYLSIIEKLKLGENLALISDAGTPLISDPGYKLVRACLQENIPIDSIPGPSSVITALTLSGLPPDKFFFFGYLPEKSGGRLKSFEQINSISKIVSTTFVVFVSPHKLVKIIQELGDFFSSDLNLTLAKELTKIHQSVESKSASDWLDYFRKQNPKGEYIMLFNLEK